MLKAALGVLVSVLAVALVTPGAYAADTAPSAKSAKSAKHKAQGKKKSTKAKRKQRTAATEEAAPVSRVASRTKKSNVHRVAYTPAPLTAGDLAGLNKRDPLSLNSNVALVIDQTTSEVLFEKNASVALPIASITKLMTSLVVVEAGLPMDETLTVSEAYVDREKFSHSRLRVGSQLSRADMLHIALMSSENRAASALGRHYPGGLTAFVAAMNAKARQLGMVSTRYVDPTGLSSSNVSSAHDLAKLVVAAYQQPVIRQYSTDLKHTVEPGLGVLHYKTSNHLVENSDWEIGLQKTGYISEAGRCMVMQARIDNRPVVMVLLDSKGKLSRIADASRVRRWIESNRPYAVNNRVIAQQS
jgi:serine-type D-Ala-D-Ala endopeptidase (penicillin-binding protein 7)